MIWQGGCAFGTGLFILAGNNDSPTLMNNLKQMRGHVNMSFPCSQMIKREDGCYPRSTPKQAGPQQNTNQNCSERPSHSSENGLLENVQRKQCWWKCRLGQPIASSKLASATSQTFPKLRAEEIAQCWNGQVECSTVKKHQQRTVNFHKTSRCIKTTPPQKKSKPYNLEYHAWIFI